MKTKWNKVKTKWNKVKTKWIQNRINGDLAHKVKIQSNYVCIVQQFILIENYAYIITVDSGLKADTTAHFVFSRSHVAEVSTLIRNSHFQLNKVIMVRQGFTLSANNNIFFIIRYSIEQSNNGRAGLPPPHHYYY